MAKFTRIEIHFEADGAPRIATIRPLDEAGRGVRKIILDRPGPFNRPIPQEITLDAGNPVSVDDGPMLCYDVNGQLVCW